MNIIKTTNMEWGFFGTSMRDYALDSETAEVVYDEVAKLLIKEVGVSKKQVVSFLDSRYGRHFSDALSFENVRKGSSVRTFVIASKKLLRKGHTVWPYLVANHEEA